MAFLVANPTTIFYRPISMGLYFLILLWLGPFGSLAGHAFNLALLALSIVLLATLVARLGGFRAGLFAGLTYAALSSVPSLVAWTTASQDLLAIVFTLAALQLRHAGRAVGSIAAAACAIFSKEPAIALLPALLLWPWVLNRKPRRIVSYGFLCLGLIALWAAVHPGVHAFVTHGFRSAATGYVHVEHPERWAMYLGRYLLTMFNLPLTGYPTTWPADLTVYAFMALALLLGGLWIIRPAFPRRPASPERISAGRAAAVAALIAVPPLALDTLLVGHWAPYYVSLPGIGAAILMGVLLSRISDGRAAVCLSLYLLLGVSCRGIAAAELAFTERNFVEASRAVRLVEARFRQLRPTMPRGAEILLSVGTTGTLGVFQTMHQGQAPRIWYGDPTLLVLPPEQRTNRGKPDLLFRITQVLSVAELAPDSLGYRWAGGIEPLTQDITGPVRAFARGTAASGDPDRAIQIFRKLTTLPPESMHPYDQRLIAMVLLSAGRKAEAEQILQTTPAYSQEISIEMAMKLLKEPTRRAAVDSSIFIAFGLSMQDPTVVREIMRRLQADGQFEQAAHFARRLQALVPGDKESAALLRGRGRQGAGTTEQSH